MVSLVSIAPVRKFVELRAGTEDAIKVPVQGISTKGLAVLIGRFPEVRAMIASQAVDLTAERLFTLVPDAIAAIIAAGMGSPGDTALEADAEQLPMEEQLDLLEPILQLTIPKGVGPFVARLKTLFGGLGVASLAAAIPDTISPEPSNS